jgi:hypothetical protein
MRQGVKYMEVRLPDECLDGRWRNSGVRGARRTIAELATLKMTLSIIAITLTDENKLLYCCGQIELRNRG